MFPIYPKYSSSKNQGEGKGEFVSSSQIIPLSRNREKIPTIPYRDQGNNGMYVFGKKRMKE